MTESDKSIEAEQAEAWRSLVRESVLHENATLREQNAALNTELDALSVSRATELAVALREVSFGTRRLWLTAGIALVSFFATLFMLNWSQPPPPSADRVYQERQRRLDEVAASLKDLGKFVATQRMDIENKHRLLQDLEKQRSELRPIVEADKQVVDAILLASEQRQSAETLKNHAVGFLVGILSSALVALAPALWRRLFRKSNGRTS